MCALGPHAFYAVASDRTSPILHLCAHLDPICLMWPSHFIGGSLTPRNEHVCTGPHAFYAVASDRTSPILHLCAHLDPICLMWPSHFIGGSLTPRN